MYRVLVLVLALASASVAAEQNGGVALHALTGRPGIDGRAWVFVDVYTGAPPTVRPANADYDLRFSDRTDDRGVARWMVALDRGGRQVLLTTDAKTSFVYVTPDAHYAVIEPLTVVDTKTGQRQAIDAGGAIKVVAIAQDGKRLFLERADGEPFELVLP